MTRELRANIIFFLVLMVLVAPGFFILMRKKLTGSDRPNFLPEPIPHVTAYVQPDPVPPNLPRVEPETVKKWVAEQAETHDGLSIFRGKGDIPILSTDHRTQLIHLASAAGATRVAVLFWNDAELATEEPILLLKTADGTARPATGTTNTTIDVPKVVRHSLQSVGYVNPPERITLIERTSDVPADAVERIDVEFASPKRPNQQILLRDRR